MPKTTIKERNKAIRLAWEREQQLVSEGKGTRNWSQDQQKDILDPDKGKAYDENGRAFEGQHMKNAAEYPEYQGDPDNIQFLTRDEHLEAHKGSWQNPTNWYYNPETKEFVDFGENKPIPCVAINLSKPICNSFIKYQNKSDELKETTDKEKTVPTVHTKPSCQEDISHHSEIKTQNRATAVLSEIHGILGDKIHRVIDAVKDFSKKHPVLIWGGAATAAIVTAAIANNISGRDISSGNGGSNNASSDLFDDYSGHTDDSNDYSDSSDSRDYPDKRSSPEEHTVPAHGQHYHTKDGVVWKEKEPYQRGSKHDDDLS